MNTKEAIEIVCVGREQPLTFNEAHKVINLLKRSEKYEAIVNELEKDYGFLGHRYAGSDSTDYLKYVIPRLKQKYFPKGDKNE